MGSPSPPVGRVPSSFKGPSSLIPPQLLRPTSGQCREGTGNTTHGLALLAGIPTQALYTLLSLEAEERQVRGPILEGAGGWGTFPPGGALRSPCTS